MTIAGSYLPALYLAALGLTLAVEVPVVVAFYPGHRLRMALVCVVANLVTHPMLVYGFPRILPHGGPTLLIGEVFATLAEAGAYGLVVRQPGRALVASAVANSLSYGLGVLFLR